MLKKILCSIFFVFFYLLANLGGVYADIFEVIKIQGEVERASGPPKLLKLEAEDNVNPLALLAFGKLPEEFMSLALQLRSDNIDLLTADIMKIVQDNLTFKGPDQVEPLLAREDISEHPVEIISKPDAPPVDLSPRALRLYNYWYSTLDAEKFPLKKSKPIQIKEKNNNIDLDIPLTDYSVDTNEVADNVLRLRYEIVNDQQMSFTAKLPRQVGLHDDLGKPIGILRFSGQDIKGIWADELEMLVNMEFLLADAAFLPYSLDTGNVDPEMLAIERLLFTLEMEEAAASIWNGHFKTEGSNIRLVEGNNGGAVHIGSFQYHMEFNEHDIHAFSDLLPVFNHLMDESDWSGFSEALKNLMLTYGDAKVTITVKDMDAGQIEELEHLSFNLFTAKGDIKKTGIHPNQRHLSGEYQIRDLKVRSDEADVSISAFKIESGLAGLNLASVAQLVDNPFEFFTEFPNLLEGFHFGFSASGLQFQGRHEDTNLSGLAEVGMRMSVSGLNVSMQNLAFNYHHSGLKVKDEETLPKELTPINLTVGGQLSNIPTLELMGPALFGSEDVTPLLLALLSKHGSKLELDGPHIIFPTGGLQLKGIASVDGPELSEVDNMPVLQVDTVFDISGIDTLAKALAKVLDSEEDLQNLKAIVAFIKLAAEEKTAEDGTTIHHLKIKGNNQGEITANGKDLMPLLNLMHLMGIWK